MSDYTQRDKGTLSEQSTREIEDLEKEIERCKEEKNDEKLYELLVKLHTIKAGDKGVKIRKTTEDDYDISYEFEKLRTDCRAITNEISKAGGIISSRERNLILRKIGITLLPAAYESIEENIIDINDYMGELHIESTISSAIVSSFNEIKKNANILMEEYCNQNKYSFFVSRFPEKLDEHIHDVEGVYVEGASSGQIISRMLFPGMQKQSQIIVKATVELVDLIKMKIEKTTTVKAVNDVLKKECTGNGYMPGISPEVFKKFQK